MTSIDPAYGAMKYIAFFRFEAPIHEVRDYMVGPDKFSKFFSGISGGLPVYAYLWLEPRSDEGYLGGMMVYASEDRPDEERWFRRNALSLIRVGPVKLELIRTIPGEVIISLYMHPHPDWWAWVGGDPEYQKSEGEPFVLKWWENLIEGWIDRAYESSAVRTRGDTSNQQRETVRPSEQIEDKPSLTPVRPAKPAQGSALQAWIDYYHKMREAGLKTSFPMIAQESGYAAGTLKNEHKGCQNPLCLQRRGNRNMTENDQ